MIQPYAKHLGIPVLRHNRAPTPCELSEHTQREPADVAAAANSAEKSVSEQQVPVGVGISQARVQIEESSRIAGSQLDAGSQGTSNEDRCCTCMPAPLPCNPVPAVVLCCMHMSACMPAPLHGLPVAHLPCSCQHACISQQVGPCTVHAAF
eukprot:1137110-Pelagomonas_calceolata.AAC.3